MVSLSPPLRVPCTQVGETTPKVIGGLGLHRKYQLDNAKPQNFAELPFDLKTGATA